MWPEKNPLDLNNLPDDGKQIFDEASSSGYRNKKNGSKEGKEGESEKVYECRFCSLKFCKSQALGGHMNRHRQERETETLNRARQLVFSNDNFAPQPPPHLGCQTVPPGCYNMGDPTMAFRSAYPSSRLITPSTPRPPPQPYGYPPPSRLVSYPSQYPHHMKDCYVGHVMGSSTQYPVEQGGGYTCIGAPVGHGYGSVGGNRDGSLQNQVDVMNWGRGYAGSQQQQQQQQQQHMDTPTINQYQDGF